MLYIYALPQVVSNFEVQSSADTKSVHVDSNYCKLLTHDVLVKRLSPRVRNLLSQQKWLAAAASSGLLWILFIYYIFSIVIVIVFVIMDALQCLLFFQCFVYVTVFMLCFILYIRSIYVYIDTLYIINILF